jgi:hypothetical protein
MDLATNCSTSGFEATTNLPLSRISKQTLPTMSGMSLASYAIKRPWMKSMLQPLANWFNNASGYRKMGLL